MTRHGGGISVESEEGEGTTYHLRFPAVERQGLAPEPVNTALPPDPATVRNSGSFKLLVVEDEEQNLVMFRDILVSEGYKVFTAREGHEALSKFEQEDIDLVITDLSMPGLSGLDVSKRVKELKPHIPVILLSGWAVQENESKAKEASVDHVLAKPCPLDVFLDAVAKALERRAAA